MVLRAEVRDNFGLLLTVVAHLRGPVRTTLFIKGAGKNDNVGGVVTYADHTVRYDDGIMLSHWMIFLEGDRVPVSQ